jgi:hypothetical protein
MTGIMTKKSKEYILDSLISIFSTVAVNCFDASRGMPTVVLKHYDTLKWPFFMGGHHIGYYIGKRCEDFA